MKITSKGREGRRGTKALKEQGRNKKEQAKIMIIQVISVALYGVS